MNQQGDIFKIHNKSRQMTYVKIRELKAQGIPLAFKE